MSELTPAERAEVETIYNNLYDTLAREELAKIAARFETLTTIEGLHCRFRSSKSHVPGPDGQWRYTEVADEATLFEESHRAAYIGAGMAAHQLGVPAVPLVKWVAPESEMEREYAERYGCREWESHVHSVPVKGFMYPAISEAIYLRADLTPTQAFLTAAHEVSHVADALAPHPVDWDESEIRARNYALHARKALHVVIR